MRADIVSRRNLSDLPSASALEIWEHLLFIVGDDSRFVFVLDSEGRELGRVPLFSASGSEQQRIPKKNKPDLEASLLVPDHQGVRLFIFGSGSRSPQRDVCYSLRIPTACLSSADPQSWNHTVRVEKRDMISLYDSIRDDRRLGAETASNLNIEAAALVEENLLLFQRGVKGRSNAVISMRMRDFSNWFLNSNAPLPSYDITIYGLPSLDGIGTGFSGATVEPGKQAVIFCASAEDTADPILDGKVCGSILGNLSWLEHARVPQLEWAEISFEGERFVAKVESLAFKARLEGGSALLFAVTDDDQGGSELLEILVSR